MRPTSNRRSALLICVLVLASSSAAIFTQGQTGASAVQPLPSYTLALPVDEVGLTFHAADANGLPVNDLKLDELRLLDNGTPPHRILAFYSLLDHPIRAGILVDTSESMENSLAVSRAIASRFARQVLRQSSDHAFVMEFGYSARIIQPWTNEPLSLSAAIRNIAAGRDNPVPGTAIFNTLYRTCSSEFVNVDHPSGGNVILLFSDGEDNAGLTTLKDVVNACQRTNTAIYAFRMEPATGLISSGPKNLADLVEQTGGRVFSGSASDAEVDSDLRTIEADLHNQYRLVFKPSEWRHDGSFHRIELNVPARVNSVMIPSGYYAPVR
jgi:Ca-activated chloride channel homolog